LGGSRSLGRKLSERLPGADMPKKPCRTFAIQCCLFRRRGLIWINLRAFHRYGFASTTVDFIVRSSHMPRPSDGRQAVQTIRPFSIDCEIADQSASRRIGRKLFQLRLPGPFVGRPKNPDTIAVTAHSIYDHVEARPPPAN
jgi:hypothetical protein